MTPDYQEQAKALCGCHECTCKSWCDIQHAVKPDKGRCRRDRIAAALQERDREHAEVVRGRDVTVAALQAKLAERDATIARLTAELAEAKRLLGPCQARVEYKVGPDKGGQVHSGTVRCGAPRPCPRHDRPSTTEEPRG